MYCKNCGAHIDDDSKFCSSCGVSLKIPKYQSSENYNEPPEELERLNFLIESNQNDFGFSINNNILEITEELVKSKEDAHNVTEQYRAYFDKDLIKELIRLSNNYKNIKTYVSTFIKVGYVDPEYPHKRVPNKKEKASKPEEVNKPVDIKRNERTAKPIKFSFGPIFIIGAMILCIIVYFHDPIEMDKVTGKKSYNPKDFFEKEMKSNIFRGGNNKNFRGNFIKLKSELLIFALWADSIAKYENHAEPEISNLAKDFKSKVIALQKKQLPELRKAYANEMKRIVWEVDGQVHIGGANYSTIEFVSADFYFNRNIKKAYEGIINDLHMFRFKQINFLSSKYDRDYTYFALKSPNDEALFNSNIFKINK